MAAGKEEALFDRLRERGVTRVKVGVFDVDGLLRGKYMSLDKLRSALSGGFGFCDVVFGWDIADALYDSSSVTGWESGFPDAEAVIDPDTLRELPWEPHTAALLADFRAQDGGPHPACPRSLLRTVRDKALAMGFEPKFSCELEFFLFKETADSLHDKGFRDLRPLTPGMFGYSFVRAGQNRELMADILEGMSAFDIEIEGLHTETGPGVYEAAIVYDDILAAADKAALFKVAMKQIAHEHGLSVTFMAKWNQSLPGSSGHLHQSLWRDGKNAFFREGKPSFREGKPSFAEGGASFAEGGASEVLRHYLGGQCALMAELTALISPNINSYKRYVPGVWAPLTVSWAVENRTTAVRLIGLSDPQACRIEFRQPAADLNPYIAMAACLGAGLYGIDNAIEPPPETRGNATEQGPRLPRSLDEAIELLAASERAPELFGDGFVSHYLHTRRWEVKEYRRAVTDWELRRYFEAI